MFSDNQLQDCFEKAFKYLEDLDRSSAGYFPYSKIIGIGLVSQDDTALAEAKRIARRYFLNVKNDNVVQVSTGLVSSPEAEDDFGQNCATLGVVVSVSIDRPLSFRQT